MSEKVLVVIADEQVRVYHTPGVETAVIVDGEDVQLPDDWTDLPGLVFHSLPITVRGDEMFKRDDFPPVDGYLGSTSAAEQAQMMKAPYCLDCDGNHPEGECPLQRGCSTCGAAYGEKHKGGCADQNALVPGGDIVR